ncbi:MAG TPA: DNA recombination protein RmuC [Acidimicrobiales bacterium]|nr:DNA recombination protein RmuC [Acidimicrobiales bacterium]
MDPSQLVAGAIVGLVVGLVVARLVARSVTASASAALRRHSGAERDALVRTAVDAVVAVAGERLGAQADAGSRELRARHEQFAERVGRLRADVTGELSLRNAAVEAHMGQVRGELAKVADLVVGLQRDRAEQQGRVESRLAEVAAVSAELAHTTQSLRRALASPQARGQWGERMADDVLRAAGLVEGISYRKQATTAAGTIPDFTFLLPGGRVLHMDVKFPIDNYLRYLEATSDAERNRHRAAFVRDVRNRVRELSGRVYIDPDDTLDEVLLFIPNEAVYAFVHTHDRDLVEVALGQKVVLCSPSTLFSVLAVIRQAVEQTQLQRTSDEILRCLAAFEAQWGRFAEAMDKVGRGLDTVRRGWDDLAGTRRRQLERQLDRVGELRVRRDGRPLLVEGTEEVEADGGAGRGVDPGVGCDRALDLGPEHERELGRDHDRDRDRDRSGGLGDVHELPRRPGSDAATG